MTYIQLSYGDLVLPALLVVMDGALSLILRLKLERQLAIATVRMVLQLALVGYVLTFLFAAVSPLWTALAAFIMVLFASREIVARQKRRLPGIWNYGLGAGCTLLAAGTVTMFALHDGATPRSLVSSALCAAFVGHDPGQHHDRDKLGLGRAD